MLKRVAEPSASPATPGETNAPKRFDLCTLHIGTEKTGTTSIQRYLRLNRALFRKQGILYPAAIGEAQWSQWELVAASHETPWAIDAGKSVGLSAPEDVEPYRARLVEDLREEFDRTPNTSRLLLSSEHLHSRLTTPDAVGRLKAMLDRWAASYRIIFYIRRQDRLAVSYLSTQLKSGAHQDGPVTLPAGASATHYYAYDALFDLWASVFGTEAMAVRLYDPEAWQDGDLISDFCAAAHLPATGRRPDRDYNKSLNRSGSDVLRAFNRQLASGEITLSDADRDLFSSSVAVLSRGKHYPIDRAAAEAFYKPFKPGNERLLQLAFPERSAPLFDEDFSEYPETVDTTLASYDDAVRLAFELWQLGRKQGAANRWLSRWLDRLGWSR